MIKDKFVFGMAILRLLSGSIEITAALLMLKFNKVEIAFKINSLLAMVGPTVLILTTTIGLAGLAGKMPFSKMAFIISGVLLIFVGLRK